MLSLIYYVGPMPKLCFLQRLLKRRYCEENKIEVETVGRLISKALKEKIQVECTTANLLKMPEAGKLPL